MPPSCKRFFSAAAALLFLQLSSYTGAKAQNLEAALGKNDTAAVLQYLKAGASINAPLESGNTPLLTFSRTRGNESVVEFLLRHGADPNIGQSAKGRTALTVACAYYGGMRLIKDLVKAGAIINTADQDGVTPLMMAAKNGKLGVVKYLVSKGAQVTAKDKKGATALSYAQHVEESEYIRQSVKDDTIDAAAVAAFLQAQEKHQ